MPLNVDADIQIDRGWVMVFGSDTTVRHQRR